MRLCRACEKELVRKHGEAKGNYDKRLTCDRVCQAHYRHRSAYKLAKRKKVDYVPGAAPLRLPIKLRALLEIAVLENPELGQFLLECVEPPAFSRSVDSLADYGVR